MRVREQRRRTPPRRDAEAPAGWNAARAADLREELDDVLDEIDGLLEQNAEEFVKAYVQKGGE